MSLMLQKLTLLTPLASDNVACVPAEELLIVIKFPLVPETLKAPTVVVVLAGNVIVAGWAVLVMLAKVLACWMVSAPVPPWFNVGHVNAPPANVLALVLVMLIVPVEALTVRFAALVFALQATPLPAAVHVPDPSVSVLVPTPKANEPRVTFLLLPSNVPLVSVVVLALFWLKLSANVQVPPTPLNAITPLNETPLDVIVLVPDVDPNLVIGAFAVTVMPAPRVRFP